VTAVAMTYEDFWFHDGPWTEEDYLMLPKGGPKIELVEGRLIVSPAPRKAHQQLMQRLAVFLDDQSPDDLDVVAELNVRVGPEKVLIPDVVATYEQGGDVVMHDPAQVLLIAEVLSPSNHGGEWLYKNHLYAKARIPWYLIVEVDGGEPALNLQRLQDGVYTTVGKAACGQILRLPEPLGGIDPADLLRRR
jgi:Uma2 family endonuclease